MNRDNIYHILIGKTLTPAATSIATLAEGEIAIVKPDMTLLTAGETISDAEYFYVVQGTASGNPPKFSPKIQGRNIKRWAGKSYTAAVEQVTYVGNDGAGTGSINVSNETEYSLHLTFKHTTDIRTRSQDMRTYHYTSDASATQQEIADAFVALINDDEYANQFVVAATVNTATDYGIQITGLAQTYRKIDRYTQVLFEVTLGLGFDSTTQLDELGSGASSVSPNPGSGTYALVSDMEYEAQGFEGITNRTQFPVPSFPEYAVSGATYDVYVIDYFDRHESKNLEQTIDAHQQLMVAIPASSDNGLNFEALANPYMASTPNAFSAVTL